MEVQHFGQIHFLPLSLQSFHWVRSLQLLACVNYQLPPSKIHLSYLLGLRLK